MLFAHWASGGVPGGIVDCKKSCFVALTDYKEAAKEDENLHCDREGSEYCQDAAGADLHIVFMGYLLNKVSC